MTIAISDRPWGTKYPQLVSAPLSVEPYLSQEYFELARERLFRRACLEVGHESQLPKGFISVSLDARRTLAEFLGLVAVLLKGGDWNQYKLQRRYDIGERANWKVSIDAENDRYHIDWRHRQLMPKHFMSNEKGFGRAGDITFLGHNRSRQEP